jgi:hypothetical protein
VGPVAEVAVKFPPPLCDKVTEVALTRVLPLTVTAVVPHVEAVLCASVIFGGFVQPQFTVKEVAVLIQFVFMFLAVRVWVPMATGVNVVLA